MAAPSSPPASAEQQVSIAATSMSPTDAAIFVPIDLEASLGKIEDVTAKNLLLLQQQQQQQLYEQQVSSESTRSSSASSSLTGDNTTSTVPLQTASATQENGSNGIGSCPQTPTARRRAPTRTSSKAPQLAQHIIAPFPVIETPDELQERQTLNTAMVLSTVLNNSNNNNSSYSSSIDAPPFMTDGEGDDEHIVDDGDIDMVDEEMVVSRHDLDHVVVPLNDDDDNENDNNDDDDDFSLSAEEAQSLHDEDLPFDTMQRDPVSFWECPTVVAAPTTSMTSSSPQQAQQQKQLFIPDSVSFSSGSAATATQQQQEEKQHHGVEASSSGMDCDE